MKIRKGFVSNSSSSSFVFIGREISIDEAEKLYKTSRIYVDTDIEGGEGYYIIPIQDQEAMEVFKRVEKGEFNYKTKNTHSVNPTSYYVEFHLKYYECFVGFANDLDEVAFNPSDLPPMTCKAFYFSVDQHTPTNAIDIEQMFIDQRKPEY